MKLQLHLTIILLFLFIAQSQATIIISEIDFTKAAAAMKKAGYSPAKLWMETNDSETEYAFWKVEEANLIILHSLKTKKIINISYWRNDKQQTFDLDVKSFNTDTGEITIQTKKPKKNQQSSFTHEQKETAQSKGFKRLLNGITLPYVSFEKEDEYTLLTAVSLAVSRAIEHDTFRKKGETAGFARFVTDKNKHYKDCVIFPEGTKEIKITYEARNILLHNFLVDIARQSKLDLYATSDGLAFSRPDENSRKELLNKKLTIWFAIYRVDSKKTPIDSK